MFQKLTFDSSLALKRNHLGRRVHDGALGGNGSPDGICRVGHVDDDHLRRLADFLAHADKLVALHCERRKRDVGHIDADARQLSQNSLRLPTLV